jgi:hypothetical protein
MRSDEPTQIRKILLLTANPKGTFPLRLDEEHRRIKDSLKQSESRNQFDIHVEPAVTIPHIRRALLELKPEIVHFCGHGAGTDGIVCEDDHGQIKLIPTTALSNLFELVSRHVKCVVLNACFAEIQANEIFKHIEVVVGMKHSIGDEAALRFAEGFYDALFAGNEFVVCHKWGVNAIQLENIPEDLTPIIKIKVPVKKTVKVPVKKLSKVSINSTEKISTAPSSHLTEPAAGNLSPALSTSTSKIPVTQKHPLLQWMPKRAFLSLLIPAFLYIFFFISTDKQYDIAGNYMQESLPEDINQRGDTSDHIRWDAINTELHVSFNSKTGKWQAREITFLKYYYAPDLNHLETRYFIGSSKAVFMHEEQSRQGGKIRMTGHPVEGQVWLQVEPLLGEQKLIDEIKEAVNKEIDFNRKRYTESVNDWSLDENGNLIKEKWYKDQDPSKPGRKEKFIRRF